MSITVSVSLLLLKSFGKNDRRRFRGPASVRCLGDGGVSCRLTSDDVAMSSVHALLEDNSDAAPDGVGWGGGLPPLTVSIGRAPIVNIGSTYIGTSVLFHTYSVYL